MSMPSPSKKQRLMGIRSITDHRQPDMVLVMYNPGAFEAHNANMFQFLP